jgi:2-polyprenyl-3-methyl-5-hydroxy-6-metoxy-1,4-benzoquinol methylase
VIRFLLFVKSLFRKIGIDISFVKRNAEISAIKHNTEESMDNFWADPKNEKTWKNPELLKFYKKIVDIIKKNGFNLDGKSILDAGCGTASLLIYVNQVFKPLKNTGFEFSKKAIEIAKYRFPEAIYEYINLNDKPEKQFDFVFCTEVLEHIVNPHVPLQNLLKMLNKGSGLIITVPNGRKDTYDGHINFWSPESWDAFINQYAIDFNVETGEIIPFGLYALIKAKV